MGGHPPSLCSYFVYTVDKLQDLFCLQRRLFWYAPNMAKRGRPPGFTNAELIEALGKAGNYVDAAEILDSNRDTVRRRAVRLGLIWVPAHEELRDEIVTLTVQHQKQTDEA